MKKLSFFDEISDFRVFSQVKPHFHKTSSNIGLQKSRQIGWLAGCVFLGCVASNAGTWGGADADVGGERRMVGKGPFRAFSGLFGPFRAC